MSVTLFNKIPPWVEDDAIIDLDFAEGRYYQKNLFGDFSDHINFSRESPATLFIDNILYTFPNNSPRILPNLGLYIEDVFLASPHSFTSNAPFNITRNIAVAPDNTSSASYVVCEDIINIVTDKEYTSFFIRSEDSLIWNRIKQNYIPAGKYYIWGLQVEDISVTSYSNLYRDIDKINIKNFQYAFQKNQFIKRITIKDI